MKLPSFHKVLPWILALAMTLNYGCGDGRTAPAEIKIDTEPTAASISINGKDVGRTPYMLKQPANGKYVLQFTKDGFDPMDRVIQVAADSPGEIVTQLKPITGFVLFETVPTGVEISIDGSFKGKSPTFSVNLPAGQHKASFSLEGFDTRELTFTITDRIPKLCQMNMRSIYATVQVESTPKGATVIIDGIHKGTTPCEASDISLGTHTIKLIKEGYKLHTGEITLTQTGTFPYKYPLEEQLAALEITSTPADAKVTFNGEAKGRTPLQVSGLRNGRYTVVFEIPGYTSETKIVEIKNNKDSHVEATLEKATGTLVLNISPPNSNIMVDSQQKGVSEATPFIIDLMPGSHNVEITKAGHRNQSFAVAIEKGKATQKDVALNRYWKKDFRILLKDGGRVREGMLVGQYPNGNMKIETNPGVFEEYTSAEVQSTETIKE